MTRGKYYKIDISLQLVWILGVIRNQNSEAKQV